MLPARSKRYAVIDGEIPRLTLASNWQLALVALLVLALLVVIFPRRALVDQLYEQDVLDDLTLSYIQNLYRSDEDNADVTFLLARSQQDRMEFEELEAMASSLLKSGDSRHADAARIMLVGAYERFLAQGGNDDVRGRVRVRFTDFLSTFNVSDLPERLVGRLAVIAFELQLTSSGMTLLRQVESGNLPVALEQYGDKALSRGRHDAAAEFYLAARDLATGPDEARRLFFAGIGAYMAASHFDKALEAAGQHLGSLSTDSKTLRYMARTALAAGSPAHAAKYARMLVFESKDKGKTL